MRSPHQICARWGVVLTSFFAILVLPMGCGQGMDRRIQLRYMAWGNPEQLAVEQQLVDSFMKREPGIHVRLFKVPGSAYANKMVIMLASRTAPDVMRVDHMSFPDLVRKNYFRDLTPLAASDPDFHESDFFPLAIEEGKYRGRLYGLNVLLGGVLLYYNKTMIQKAGLEDPYLLAQRGTWTWDRLREYALRLTRTDPNGRPLQFGMQIPSFPQQVSVLYSFGGSLLSTDQSRCALETQEAVRCYQYLSDLRWKDHVAPTPSQGALSAFNFESGKLGMVFDWAGMAPRYRKAVKDFEWDLCPIPSGPSGEVTVAKGNQLVMYRECAHPDAAWKFMRYLTGPEAEQKLCGALRRAVPARKAVAYSQEFLKATLPPFHTRVYVEAMEHGRTLPIDARWVEWTTAMNAELDNLWSGRDREVTQVLQRAAVAVDAVRSSEEGY